MRLLLLLAAFAAAPALAQPPSLAPTPDPTFNGGAPLVEAYATWGYAVAAMPDGRFLTLSANLWIARYLPDGAPDPSFGTDGRVQVAPVSMREEEDDGLDRFTQIGNAGTLEILPDGRILFAHNRTLGRLTPDGALDPTFGDGGRVTIPQTYFFRSAHFARTPDGTIWWAGFGRNGSLRQFALVRLSPDGERFPDDGPDGVKLFGPDGLVAHRVAVRQGRLWVVGTRNLGSITNGAVVARLTYAGEPDEAWGVGGFAEIPGNEAPGAGSPYALGFQRNEQLVVAGHRREGSLFRPFAARFTINGEADETFGDGGVAVLPISNNVTNIFDLVVLPDDRIVGVGSDALITFAADGSEHRADVFRAGNFVGTEEAMALMPDGRVLAVGTSRRISPPDVDRLTIQRFTTSLAFVEGGDGTLDPDFNDTGVLVADVAEHHAIYDSVVLPDGSSVTLLTRPTLEGTRVRLFKVRPDGTPDETFGPGGLAEHDVVYTPTALTAVPEGFLLVATEMVGGVRVPAVARWTAAGVPDATWGEGGIVRVASLPGAMPGSRTVLLRLSDGRLVFVAPVLEGGVIRLYAIRLSAAGALDATFGSGGTALVPGTPDFPAFSDLLVKPDGRLLVLFTVGASVLTPSGTPDATFGDGGAVLFETAFGVPPTYQAQRIRRDGVGRLVVIGDAVLLRLTPAGTPDATFGEAGVVAPGFGTALGRTERLLDAHVLADGKLVVAGWLMEPGANTTTMFVGRATSEGLVDETFGDGGSARFGFPFRGQRFLLDVDADGRAVAVAQTHFSGRSRALLTAFDAGAGLVLSETEASTEPLALAVFPNPTASVATVAFTLGAPVLTEVALFDLLGRRVRVLHERALPAGAHALHAELGGLAPGVYVVRVRTGETVQTQRVSLVR